MDRYDRTDATADALESPMNYSLDGLSEGGGDERKQSGETAQHVVLSREMNELLYKRQKVDSGLERWLHKRRSKNDR